MKFEYRAPGKIYCGEGLLKDSGGIVRSIGQRALVVTGAGGSTLRSGSLEKLEESLRGAGVVVARFAEVEADPSITTCEKGAHLAGEFGANVIVALGGGSPMDAAKGISLLTGNRLPLDRLAGKSDLVRGLPVVAIPTTAGTASEVTRFTVITDPVKKEKVLIASDTIIPEVAILDPELTLTMPPLTTAATGLDALTHALESVVSKLATPLSDLFSYEAARDIMKWLPVVLRSPENLEARGEMLFAQMRAGLAFSNSSVALVHAMSRPLGAWYGIPHGVANALLLVPVMRFNLPDSTPRLAEVYRLIRGEGSGDDITDGTHLVDELERLVQSSPLPGGLGELGVPESSLPDLALEALKSGSAAMNPRIATVDEIQQLFRQAMELNQ